jgi:hypothetical protein
MKKKVRFDALNFEVNVDGRLVEVMAKPYEVNNMKRFRVSYDGSPIHIFGVDRETNKMRVIDSAAQQIPETVERAISRELVQVEA